MERCLRAGQTLTGNNMKAALESIRNWDTGGIMGRPVSLARHQIPMGRIYQYDSASKLLQPASDWITMEG
jgi:branched-chain amino acid transport system substrate-binding protein